MKEMKEEIMEVLYRMPDKQIRELFYEMEIDYYYPRVRSSKTMRELVIDEEHAQLDAMDCDAVKGEWKCFCGNRKEVRA
jgi:hypothetical protein